MINWLTAIFGFLAIYAGAGLFYTLTRDAHSSESVNLLVALMVVAVAAAFINEWRARRAKGPPAVSINSNKPKS
jgi:uncharacterized membrane protein YbhN (UPF0104 family)